MIKHLLDTIDVDVRMTQFIPFLTYEGDNPAYNFLPQEVIQEIEHLELNKELSFALIKVPSLELVGYIILIEENYNHRQKGIKIHSIGYANEEIFNHIVRFAKDNLALRFNGDRENKYDYIWGYEYKDFTYLAENFNIDYQNNIFISELQR